MNKKIFKLFLLEQRLGRRGKKSRSPVENKPGGKNDEKNLTKKKRIRKDKRD